MIRRFRENDQVSGVSFENTNTVNFFLTGFECEKETVSMILTDIGKSAL